LSFATGTDQFMTERFTPPRTLILSGFCMKDFGFDDKRSARGDDKKAKTPGTLPLHDIPNHHSARNTVLSPKANPPSRTEPSICTRCRAINPVGTHPSHGVQTHRSGRNGASAPRVYTPSRAEEWSDTLGKQARTLGMVDAAKTPDRSNLYVGPGMN